MRKKNKNKQIDLFLEKEQFIEPIDEYFICTICTGVLHNPCDLKCGHMFCISCLTRSEKISGKTECPNCKTNYKEDESKLKPNYAITQKISTWKLKCPYTKDGCTWVDTIGFNERNIQSHLLKDCSFFPMKCNKCHKEMVRSKWKSHEKEECSERRIVCEFCQDRIKFKNYENHLHPETFCVNLMLCEHKCLEEDYKKEKEEDYKEDKKEEKEEERFFSIYSSSKKRKLNLVEEKEQIIDSKYSSSIPVYIHKNKKAYHENQECSRIIITCPIIGCGFQCCRKEMNTHLTKNYQEHLIQLTKEIRFKTEEITELNKQLRLSKQKIRKTNYSQFLSNGYTFTFKIKDLSGILPSQWIGGSGNQCQFTIHHHVGPHKFYLHFKNFTDDNSVQHLSMIFISEGKSFIKNTPITIFMQPKNNLSEDEEEEEEDQEEEINLIINSKPILLVTEKICGDYTLLEDFEVEELKKQPGYNPFTDSLTLFCYIQRPDFMNHILPF